jgi:hypothetical protein
MPWSLCSVYLTEFVYPPFRALLTLTEPMSSGWGGGCQIVVKMADGRVMAIDGSSEAPAGIVGVDVPSYGGEIFSNFNSLLNFIRSCLCCSWLYVCHDVVP